MAITISRAEILRAVISASNNRRDGRLPLDVPGVAEAFGHELDLLGALQLRWHTRLCGEIERALNDEPMDLEQAVIAAWHATADQLPGLLAILDRYRAEPGRDAVAEAMRRSTVKERSMLAMMAGRASNPDSDETARIGAAIEEQARATYSPAAAA